MRQVLERGIFRITFDTAFRDVITGCSMPRKHEQGTWITGDMVEAYIKLHELGFAHSIEAWKGDSLAGGVYGVSLGRTFFGESMFSRESNASKAAFITLAINLQRNGFDIIDCQVHTEHLESLGAFEMPRGEFISIIRKSLNKETIKGNWGESRFFVPFLSQEELRSQGCEYALQFLFIRGVSSYQQYLTVVHITVFFDTYDSIMLLYGFLKL
jgi:leucyl/phenylalanyl-tRNA--protein transferase